jgi:hypothetical protein
MANSCIIISRDAGLICTAAEDIAESIIFPATERASFIDGAKLAVDGRPTANMTSTLNTASPQVPDNIQPEEFDLVILGGGTGSTLAAWTFAGEGKRVAVVDRKYIGGSCPNIACLPSKNIIHSAKVASYFRRSEEFGIAHNGFRMDMRGVRERKRRMVIGLNEMYFENYRNTGAEFILGTGRFTASKTVEVTLSDGATRQLRGTHVIVSTGTRAAIESIPGLAEAQQRLSCSGRPVVSPEFRYDFCTLRIDLGLQFIYLILKFADFRVIGPIDNAGLSELRISFGELLRKGLDDQIVSYLRQRFGVSRRCEERLELNSI